MEDNDYQPQFDNLTILKTIYKTKNSIIYLVKNSLNSDKISILKGMFKEQAKNSINMIKRERQFYEENAKLQNNNYPYFIKAYQDEKCIYMEISFIEGLNFSELLLNDNLLKFNYKESNLPLYIHLSAQIISLIEHLHKNNYIYRDLKLNNLIIDKNLNLYLLDFGFVKHFDDNNFTTNTICGTLHMMAPEIILAKEGKNKSYNGISIDIYSIGVILYEMYMGKSPFGYKNQYSNEIELINKILKGLNDEEHFNKETFYSNFNTPQEIEMIDFLKDLIKGCMNINPDKRFTISQIKNHKFFRNNFDKFAKKSDNLICPDDKSHLKDIMDYIKFSGEFIEDYEINEDKKRMDDIFNNFF